MKNHICLSFLVLTCTGFATSVQANEPASGVDLNAGLIISTDYNDMLDKAYPNADITGGYGWLGLGIGYKWQINPNLSVTPGISFLFNAVDSNIEDSYANTILLPMVVGRYVFSGGAGLYVGAELNQGNPSTGSDQIEFDSGGIGYGVMLGYAMSESTGIELVAEKIPVDVTFKLSGEKEEYNFGGLSLRFHVNF